MNQSDRYTRILPDATQTLLLKAATGKLPEATEAWTLWKKEQEALISGNAGALINRLKNGLDPCSFRLLPLVHNNLESSGEIIPKLLQPIYQKIRARNQRVLTVTQDLAGQLEQAGIEIILLKGVPLTCLYYRDPGVRISADVDFLVPRNQFKDACVLLERKMKFIPQVKTGSFFFSGMLHVMHSQAFRGDFPFELDMHHRLFHEHVQDGKTAIFRQQKRRMVLSPGFEADVLSPTHLLFHVLAHARSPKPAIRWVADAVMICREEPGICWQSLVQLAEAHQFVSFFKIMLPFLHRYFGIAIPEDVLDRLSMIPENPLEADYFRAQEREEKNVFLKMQQFFYRDWLQQQLYSDPPPSAGIFIKQQAERIKYRIWEGIFQ